MKTQTTRSSRPGPRRGGILLVAAVSLCAGTLSAQGPDKIGSTRSVLEKWIETRGVLSKERKDWAEGKEVLEARIDIVANEIESLRTKITDAEASISEADKSRQELIEQNERLKEAAEALSSSVVALETRTVELLRRLPDPVLDVVKPISQRIPVDPNDTELSLSERFLNVVGVLNEVDRFNREITVTSEVRNLSDGTSVEVTALYVGVGQGYYANASGTVAGIGTASDEGWVWTPANEAAESITKAIAILQNEEVAEFVRLPIRIR